MAGVNLLHARTEGWPAALRIVVSTAAPGQDFSGYVRSLSGMQRPIDAYLAEMLAGLPDDLLLFMLRTAILDRLSAPLCEAVGWARAGTLEQPRRRARLFRANSTARFGQYAVR